MTPIARLIGMVALAAALAAAGDALAARTFTVVQSPAT